MESLRLLPGGAHSRQRLSRMLASGKLRVSAGFLFGAIAFAAGNLLLAGHLPTIEYGTLALILAINAVGTALAPLGLAVMVASNRFPISMRAVKSCTLTSFVVASGAATVGALVYGLNPAALGIIVTVILTGGLIRLVSAGLQRDERYLAATMLSESGNYMLLLGAAVMVLARIEDYMLPLIVVAVAQVVVVAAIWRRLVLHRRATVPEAGQAVRLADSLLLTGSSAAMLLFLQIERLTIPIFLDIEALATFAVVALFAIAPFRPMEVGVYRTLLSSLGRMPDPMERRLLLRREARHTAIMLAIVGVAVAVITPMVLTHMFAGKYAVGIGTALAAMVGGQLRVVRSFTAAVIAALGGQRTLVWWNVSAWLSVIAVLLGGWAGAAWGLQGFLWGVVLGASINFWLTVPLVLKHVSGALQGTGTAFATSTPDEP